MTRTATPIIVCTLLASALLASTPALAEWPPRDAFWRCDEYRPGRDWRRWANRNCHHWRRHHARRPSQATATSATDKHGCMRRPVHVWSGQHNTDERARADARLRWMIAAQSEHGNVYMSFPIAADPVWRCFQSQVPDTLSAKGQALVGKYILGGEGYLMACEVWARPCPAPIETGKEK
jgi:hypothetical protein